MNETRKSLKKQNIISILAATTLLLGCGLPDLDGQDPNALVQVSPQQIGKILEPEMGTVFLDEIKVGERVKYKRTIRFEINNDIELLEDKERVVTKSEWEVDDPYIVMDYKYNWYFGEKDSFQRDEVWDSSVWNPQGAFGAQFLASFFPFSDDEPVYELKYYNLSHERVVVNPGEDILAKPNCGGLQGCVIRGIKLSYVVHLLENGKVIERQQRHEVVSGQIPPLFYFDTQNPVAAMFPVAYQCNRYVLEGTYVKDCTELVDIDNL